MSRPIGVFYEKDRQFSLPLAYLHILQVDMVAWSWKSLFVVIMVAMTAHSASSGVASVDILTT